MSITLDEFSRKVEYEKELNVLRGFFAIQFVESETKNATTKNFGDSDSHLVWTKRSENAAVTHLLETEIDFALLAFIAARLEIL